MADGDDSDDQPAVIDLIDGAIVSDADSPVSIILGHGESFNLQNMKNEVLLEKIRESKLIPEKLKQAIIKDDCKITSSLITKARVMSLYSLRREGSHHDERYQEINLRIDRMLSILKPYPKEFLLVTNILCPDRYVVVFASETVDQIFEVLDYTALGNTSNYLKSLFP